MVAMFMLAFVCLNLLGYYYLKFNNILKLEPEHDQASLSHQFNTLKRNPNVVKDVRLFCVSCVLFISFILSSWSLQRGPQPFDYALAAMTWQTFSLGFFMPLALWSSNPKIVSYTSREFWDIAPLCLIQMRDSFKQSKGKVSSGLEGSEDLQDSEDPDYEDPIFICEDEGQMLSDLQEAIEKVGEERREQSNVHRVFDQTRQVLIPGEIVIEHFM